MVSFRRSSGQVSAVLIALAEEPAIWRYGYDLCQRLDLAAGAVYPVLMRLADRGLLETAWESDVPPGRPPRHLYRLTGPGRALAGSVAGAPAPPGPARAIGGVGRRPRAAGA
jgi:PadR family transcriptional regulator